MKVFTGLIYRAKRGRIYRTDRPKDRRYDCYTPCETGDYCIVDCWVCDEYGNIHPGFNCSGVPVFTEYLGQVVNKID
ncbi:MAG: hypothetical protein HQK63_15510 [Desulfamplus sp.]|nr:hypothetical protein [Desulfamplus sp.]